MKSTEVQEQYTELFRADNPLIVDPLTDNVREELKEYMKKLDAKGKTVVTTDPYLLCTDTPDYNQLVKDLFVILQAKEVILATKRNVKANTEAALNQVLQSLQCAYTRKTPTREHDRFWICLESGKGFTIGVSINGVEKNYYRISELESEEVQKLKQILVRENVLDPE